MAAGVPLGCLDRRVAERRLSLPLGPGGRVSPQAIRNRRQDRFHTRRIEPDLGPRESQRRQSGRGMRLVAEAVLPLLRRRAVIAQPVSLDDQSEAGPMKVHLEAVYVPTRFRRREAGATGDRQEPAFELGSR